MNFDIDESIDNIMNEFDNLTDKQKILLAYRKIIELSESARSIFELFNEDNNPLVGSITKNNFQSILELIKVTDGKVGKIKPFVLYLNYLNNEAERYKKIYEKSMINYNEMLTKYKDLALELKLKNALEMSMLFSYMMWNGYYSVDKKYSYKLEDRLLIPGLYSFDIIRGNGVCLAHSQLLADYLNVCSKKSSFISCNFELNETSNLNTFKPPIRRVHNIDIRLKFISTILSSLLCAKNSKNGNHSVTLIEDDNKFYVCDSTNLYFAQIQNDSTATIINGNGKYYLKPLSSPIEIPYADFNRLYEKVLESDKKDAYTFSKIVCDYEYITALARQNIRLLNDAYDDIHHNLEFINNETNKHGNKLLKKEK